MQAPIAEQRALLQLQAHDSVIDRLGHRRGSLPEDARLATSSWMAVSSLGLVTRPEAARASSLRALVVTMSISCSRRDWSRWTVARVPSRSAVSWSTAARASASSARRASSGSEPRRWSRRSIAESWA